MSLAGVSAIALSISPRVVHADDPDVVGWKHVQVQMAAHVLHSVSAHSSKGAPAVSGVVRIVGDKVMANVPLPACPAGQLEHYAAEAYSLGQSVVVRVEGKAPAPSHVQLPLVSAEQIVSKGYCGRSSSGGELSTRLKVELRCRGYNGYSLFYSYVDVHVSCDSNYVSASTVPYGWRHTCPQGYVVKGTGQQVFDGGAPEARCIRAHLDKPASSAHLAPALATRPGGLCSTLQVSRPQPPTNKVTAPQRAVAPQRVRDPQPVRVPK